MSHIAATIPDYQGAGHHRTFFPLASFGKSFTDQYVRLYADPGSSENMFKDKVSFLKRYTVNFSGLFGSGCKVARFSRFCTDRQITGAFEFIKDQPTVFTIWDCCDDIFNILPSNRIPFEFFNNQRKQNILSLCQGVNRVVVSTVNQKHEFIDRGIDGDKIVVVPNVLHKGINPVKRIQKISLRDEKEIRFVWYGSSSYLEDFLVLILPAMRGLADALPNAVFYVNENLVPYFHQFRKTIDVRPISWQNPTVLGRFLKTNDFHFGLPLLMDTPFNRARTTIKEKEMAFCGGLLPFQQKRFYDGYGRLGKVLHPTPDEIVEWVKTIIYYDDWSERVKDCRSSFRDVWFDDVRDGYEKLFGFDRIQSP